MPEETVKQSGKLLGKDEIIPIKAEDLIEKALEMKKKGLRLSQAHCSWINDQYEISYSFADDETLDYKTLRFYADRKAKVTSVSEIFPYAAFYENEMAELFGMDIEFMNLDYHNKLYRIKKKAPFLPEEVRKAEGLDEKKEDAN